MINRKTGFHRVFVPPLFARAMKASGLWRDDEYVVQQPIPKLAGIVSDECRCRVCLEDEPIVRTTTENAIFVADRPIKGA